MSDTVPKFLPFVIFACILDINHRNNHIPQLHFFNKSRCWLLRPLSESILPNAHTEITIPTPKKNVNRTPCERSAFKWNTKKCNERIEEYFCTSCSWQVTQNRNRCVGDENCRVLCFLFFVVSPPPPSRKGQRKRKSTSDQRHLTLTFDPVLGQEMCSDLKRWPAVGCREQLRLMRYIYPKMVWKSAGDAALRDLF